MIDGTSTATLNFWSNPEKIDVNIHQDNIEMIYKETSNISHLSAFQNSPQQRVFKIVYSVVDGKWNVSDRIYGKIVPKSDEYYTFND